MTQATATRRALIAATGLAGIALAVPVLATAQPNDWPAALREYRRAKAEEDAFDARYSDDIDNWDAARERESDRVTDARYAAEDRLMAIASPTPAAFAAKYLVAHGNGRDTDCWNTMLDAEAARFATEA